MFSPADLHYEMNRLRRHMDYFFNDFDRCFGPVEDDEPFLRWNQQAMTDELDRLALHSPAETESESASDQKCAGSTPGTSASAIVEPSTTLPSSTSNVPSNSGQAPGGSRPWGWPTVGAFALTPAMHGVSLPRMDVLEKPESFVVNCDLPGISKENVKVSVTPDGVLSIIGEHTARKEQKEESAKYHRIERNYGRFKRSLQLPDTVDADAINAKHENGLLQVTLPKKPKVEAKARNVDIQ